MDKPIDVPRAPSSAYNPGRKASSLLKAQVEHLRDVGRKYPGGHDLDKAARKVKTERQAAEFVARVTQLLHPEGQHAEAHPMARELKGAVPKRKLTPPKKARTTPQRRRRPR